MRELFFAMLKEEWRIHATLFGTLGFASFPFMLTGFAFMGTFTLPLFCEVLPAGQIMLLSHYLFVLLGVMVGSFGMLGREFMNRRFGQASLVAYSSRSLPVSERTIFMNFLIKDVVYYFFLWIIPFGTGFALATPFLGIGTFQTILIIVSLTLSFLIGLSLIFFFSTIYAHSGLLLVGTAGVLATLGFFVAEASSIPLPQLLPSYLFAYSPTPSTALACLLLILLPSLVSVGWYTIEYPEAKTRVADHLVPFAGRLSVFPFPHFVAKDLLDLHRSEGGLGKIIFSLLVPLGIIWMFLSVLIRFIPGIDSLILFAALLGIISSSMYNWLTEFDSFSAYRFLPVDVGSVIRSKLVSYALLNLIPILVLVVITAGTGLWGSFFPAFLSYLSISVYALSITVYLTGLSPNVMLYQSRIFFLYLAAISPVLLGLIFISVLNPLYAVSGVLLLVPGMLLLTRSFAKWNDWDMPSF
jgi:hypothetical protein